MVFNPYGWGYGGIGYVRRPQSSIKQPVQTQSAVKPYKGEGGAEASDIGSQSAQGYSGRASAAAHGIGMGGYGKTGMALGGLVGAMVGAPVSGMRLGKAMGLNTRANQMAQGYADVVSNAAGYGISQAEVDAGMEEGDSSSTGAAGFSPDGPNAELGGLGTGGQGGIDSAGDGDSGGGKIICAELHRQGLMDDDIFYADEMYGDIIARCDPELLAGYHVWATPVVEAMQKSKIITHIVNLLASPWSKQMAYEMGARNSGSLVGKALMAIGNPLCRLLAPCKNLTINLCWVNFN